MTDLKPQNSSVDWRESVKSDTSSISAKGYFIVFITLGVFLIWSVSFPLASAVVALGKVVSTGQNKLLQLPSDGVIRKILAKDGQYLEKGEIIASIDRSSAYAELSDLVSRRDLLFARKLRLMKLKDQVSGKTNDIGVSSFELRGVNTFNTHSNNSETSILTEQENQLEAGLRQYANELKVLRKQFENLESEHRGTVLQLSAQKSRTELIQNQVEKMTPVVEEGYVARFRLWELKNNLLQAQMLYAQLIGARDSLQARMDEIIANVEVLTATINEETSEQLSDILADIASVEPQIIAAKKDVLGADIKAPVTGTLTNLDITTIGGVVRAGDVLGEIVPADAPYQIEVRIPPVDIASVSDGQKSEVIITAFNRRLDAPITGKVDYVAADSYFDESSGEEYFLVRIAINPTQDVAKRLKAGMFAEVYLQTEKRTFMSYLLRPIIESFHKAFSET